MVGYPSRPVHVSSCKGREVSANSAACYPSKVVVTVKRGLLRAGRIVTDHTSFRVRRDADGSYIVPESSSQEPGRVRYLFLRDYLFVENPFHKIEIVFHPTETSFDFDNRTYRIEPMTEGKIVIRDRDRTVVEGRVTPSGVRLERIAIELEPIQNELAFGLALRSEDLDRQFHPKVGGAGNKPWIPPIAPPCD